MVELDKAMTNDHAFPANYSKDFLLFDKGEGVYLFDKKGNRYLDFGSGISVNALGYGNREIADIAHKQMMKLIHVSNLYTTEPAVELSKKLTAGTRFSAVHFGSSGSEANEAALKYAKLYSTRTKGDHCYKVLSFTGGFHGRTMGSLAVTANKKYKEPFGPMVPGAELIEYNNIKQLQDTLNEEFAAVIIEVVQGEGGLCSLNNEFVSELKRLCNKYKVQIIADEVQTGLGRTGSIFASDEVGLEANIITLSKPLAGGLPLSATLIPDYINEQIHVGEHGTTFGGGPVTTAVACHIWDKLTDSAFLKDVRDRSDYLAGKLMKLTSEYSFVKELRGKGFLLGLDIEETDSRTVLAIMKRAESKGLLLLKTGVNVLRIAPPLIISQSEIDEGIKILQEVLGEFQSS